MNSDTEMNNKRGRQIYAAAFLWLLAMAFTPVASALIGDPSVVSFTRTAAAFPLVEAGRGATLLVDAAEFPGVRRVAGHLQADVERVSGVRPDLRESAEAALTHAVIVGTLGRGGLVDRLAAAGKIDVAPIQGKWEAFVLATVENPLPGVKSALVIAGSDKRGTIYGMYQLSEQIGVSPWYWWADVPVAKHAEIFVRAGVAVESGPVVRYRGIFINDEAPALTGWVQEKFGAFDHRFYEHVFELILRLRGNYLWPAMWQPRAFIDDDPQNAALADEYGVVLGTSHHEPMMRAHDEWERYGRGPWNYEKNAAVLQEFWRSGVSRVKDFEKIVSLGMRGDGDEPMSERENVSLLERIVSDQRRILGEVVGRPLPEIPQLWALYKEVQGYYERGMRVPDDVTLLWCDDNWGNIRRLPTAEERGRSGGAGVYYHFDYVGGPRNYKWVNTVPLPKVWEQMNLAWVHGADRIWIVNVGDIKPLELPIDFFMTMAWNPARMRYDDVDAFLHAWAARAFGAEHADEAAALLSGYTKLNGRRKPEMLAPDTYSLIHEREAERVLGEWRELAARAEKLQAALPPEARDAFFQLVLYPVKASANLQELYVSAGLNRLYAVQGRAAANTQARRVAECFANDRELVRQFHALGGGRWNHQMDQIKFGYTYWQTPNIEAAPAVQEVRPLDGASPGLAIEGSDKGWPSYGAGTAVLPPLHVGGGGATRWIEVFNRGAQPFDFAVSPEADWIRVTPASGEVREMQRVEVGVDWTKAPRGGSTAKLRVRAGEQTFTVDLPIENPDLTDARGFVEVARHVAIEAPHFDRSIAANGAAWELLAGFGRTLGAVTVLPSTEDVRTHDQPSACLEYDVWLKSDGELTVELQCAPSLDFHPNEPLRIGVSFDDAPPQILKLDTWSTLRTWETSVAEGVRKVASKHRITGPGRHVLKLWNVTPAVVVQRIVIDAGGVKPTYLGPPESPRVGVPAALNNSRTRSADKGASMSHSASP